MMIFGPLSLVVFLAASLWELFLRLVGPPGRSESGPGAGPKAELRDAKYAGLAHIGNGHEKGSAESLLGG